MDKYVKRGDVWFVDLGDGIGSEHEGYKPAVVIQNDVGNKYSPTIIVAMITSKINKAKLPTHVQIKRGEAGLTEDSMVLGEQIRTISKKRLDRFSGVLSDDKMANIDRAILISVGIGCNISEKAV